MKLYSISNWGELFENNRTRELKKLDWIPVPNKQDGEGYTLAMEQKDGPALIGAWLIILQIASKCGTRGTLMRDTGIPHDSASIARQSRFPKTVIDRAIEFFSSREVQWLNIQEIKVDTEEPLEPAEIPHVGAGIPHQGITEGKGKKEGKEEKGMESRDEPDSVLDLGEEPKSPKPPRARDPLFDALAKAEGSAPEQLTTPAARAIGVALANIKRVCPGLTADEINRRAQNYRRTWPNATITASALSKNWARFGEDAPANSTLEDRFAKAW